MSQDERLIASGAAIRAEVVRQARIHGIVATRWDVMVAACTELLRVMLTEHRLTVSEEIAQRLLEQSGSWSDDNRERAYTLRVAAEMARSVGANRTAELRDVEPVEHGVRDEHRCPSCGSPRWVSVSLNEGYTRRAQCVPCGKVHARLGPGWRSPGQQS